MNFIVNDAVLTLHVDKAIYSIDVLYKCFYWYGANFDVSIEDLSDKLYKIELISKDAEQNLAETISKIKRDLIDFKLRDTVTKETSTIRDLIVAKAFAYYDEAEAPATDVSDPVGFNPLSL